MQVLWPFMCHFLQLVIDDAHPQALTGCIEVYVPKQQLALHSVFSNLAFVIEVEELLLLPLVPPKHVHEKSFFVSWRMGSSKADILVTLLL